MYVSAEKAAQFFKADILVKDGEVLELGRTKMRFLETPGHTGGVISPFFETEENGKTYRVGMFGGAGANTLVRERFDYDNCREDYINSVHRLMGEKVDVFIGNHVWNNNTEVFGEILRKTGENKFIDSELWTDFLTYCEKRAVEIAEADR